MPAEYPPEFLVKLRSITAKRAKTVIDHILAHGQVTTEDVSEAHRLRGFVSGWSFFRL